MCIQTEWSSKIIKHIEKVASAGMHVEMGLAADTVWIVDHSKRSSNTDVEVGC